MLKHFTRDPFTAVEAYRLYQSRTIDAAQHALLIAEPGIANEDTRCEVCREAQPLIRLNGRGLCGRCGALLLGVEA